MPNPETGYLNCDGSPTKTVILESRKQETAGAADFWQLAFGRRDGEELYHVATDPECLKNLIDAPQHAQRVEELRNQLDKELAAQGDPRMDQRGSVFDRYPYADNKTKSFYERFMAGERIRAGWVNPSDFESIEARDETRSGH